MGCGVNITSHQSSQGLIQWGGQRGHVPQIFHSNANHTRWCTQGNCPLILEPPQLRFSGSDPVIHIRPHFEKKRLLKYPL